MTQSSPPQMPDAMAAVVQNYPSAAQGRFSALRLIILQEAARLDVGPIEETLKWGEPSFLTSKTKAGSTIRMGWSLKREGRFGLFFNCQTDIISRLSADFPVEFSYEGNRAATFPLETSPPEFALRAAFAMALNYHRDRRTAKAAGK